MESQKAHPRRANTLAAHSLTRFVLSVPDLAQAAKFYRAFGLDVRELTFGDVLRTAGYHNACFGKWDLAKHAQNGFFMDLFPTRQGFDYFFGTPTSNDSVVNLSTADVEGVHLLFYFRFHHRLCHVELLPVRLHAFLFRPFNGQQSQHPT